MIYNDERNKRHADMHKVPGHILSQNVGENRVHDLKQTERNIGTFRVMKPNGNTDRKDK
jgi:hypothetical protein